MAPEELRAVDRRALLRGSGSLLLMASFSACSSSRDSQRPAQSRELSFDPGEYVVSDEHLVFGDDGSMHALDPVGHQIRRLDSDQRTSATVGQLGSQNGDLNHPLDAVVGSDGSMYVLDRGNGRIQAFGTDGASMGAFGDLNMPRDLHVHGDEVIVCDTLRHRVVIFDREGNQLREIHPEFGGPDALNGPVAVDVSADGLLHVVDLGSSSVRVFDLDGSPLGSYGEYGEQPGQFLRPGSIAAAPDGRMFVSDSSLGLVSVFDGEGGFLGRFQPHSDDGEPATPVRLSFRPDGVLHIWTAGHSAFDG